VLLQNFLERREQEDIVVSQDAPSNLILIVGLRQIHLADCVEILLFFRFPPIDVQESVSIELSGYSLTLESRLGSAFFNDLFF